MEVWVWVISGLLVIGIFLLLGLNIWKVNENLQLSSRQVITPFSAKIDPTTGKLENGGFQDGNGNPQITCPVGTSVNILGAFYGVMDPYGECSPSIEGVNPLLGMMCDPSQHSVSPCSSDSDCPYYSQGASPSSLPFRCNSGFCSLQNVGESASCPSPLTLTALPTASGTGYYCMDTNTCGSNIDKNRASPLLPNPYCNPSSNQCALRDASAKVASKCDGRDSCPDLSDADFGMTPCPLTPTTCFTSYNEDGTPNWSTGGGTNERSGYCGLPYLPGYPGGVPYGGTDSLPANGNLGYTLHGIYTCV